MVVVVGGGGSEVVEKNISSKVDVLLVGFFVSTMLVACGAVREEVSLEKNISSISRFLPLVETEGAT